MTSPTTVQGPTPIDVLAPLVEGRYEDPVVTVSTGRVDLPSRTVRTEHFDVTTVDGRVLVSHVVPVGAVDDDLAGLLRDELFVPGWLRGTDLGERILTGIVRTSTADALESWELFYRNTLTRLDDPLEARTRDRAHRSIGASAPMHEHALSLLGPGSVLELGCSFGFLSLQIANSGRPTTASDVSRGTVGLLEAMSPRLGLPVTTTVADAARFPGPDGLADTVLAIHLLEHLEPEHGARVLTEALRIAHGRVIVSVPLEAEADESSGHLRTFSLDDLHAWGRMTGRAFDVHEHQGGWLVIDKR